MCKLKYIVAVHNYRRFLNRAIKSGVHPFRIRPFSFLYFG